MTNRLFNFAELLALLANNDWETDPYVTIAGPPFSGKTKLLQEFYRDNVNRPRTYSVFVPGRDFTNEDQIARAAVLAGAKEGSFPKTKVLLNSTASQVVVAASTFANTDVAISVSGSGGSRLDRSLRTLLPVLLSEFIESDVPIFFIVDQEEEASQAVEALLDGSCQAVAQGAPIRLVSTRTTPVKEDGLRRGVVEPKLLRMHPLDDEQVQRWAEDLGVPLGAREAAMIGSGTGGWSGEVFRFLTKLRIDERWKALTGVVQ